MSSLRSLVLCLALASGALVPCGVRAQSSAGGSTGILARVERELPSLKKLYLHLHANPELSLNEKRTSARMAKELRSAGFEVTEEVGGYGVVGVLRNGPGPVVMLRADMDALPIAEKTGVPYASRASGVGKDGEKVPVMHACGHDVHMTAFVGAARTLAALRKNWSGTVVALAQPAEERGYGAARVIEDGIFTRFPRPDYALAQHVSPTLEAGKVGFVEGYSHASINSVDITVRGVGGHAAYPHSARDPVVLASRIVLALQTIVSREVDPLEAAVVTVGTIHGGSKRNVIPEEVKLELTVRTRGEDTRAKVLEAIKRVAKGTAAAAGIPKDREPVVKVHERSLPAVYNSPELVRRVVEALRETLGPGNVVPGGRGSMGGDDFSRYGVVEPRIPSFMYRLGTVSPEALERERRGVSGKLPGLHSPYFLPEAEPAIRTGSAALSAAAMRLLKKL